jgi:uncharacterized protein YndB with AHSA1/START domain
MASSITADGIFLAQRIFPFTAAQIFAAFANADQLASWWGPDGFSNTFEVFEFEPQGRWNLVMHGPDGTSYPNEQLFLEVSPQRIVIEHVCAPFFTLTVTLLELATGGGDQTNLTWLQAFDDPQLAASIEHIIVPANEQNLNRLHAVLLAATR